MHQLNSEQGSQPNNGSVQNCNAFKVEDIIRLCLRTFPYIWASISLFMNGSYLIMVLSFLSNSQLVRASSY